MAQNDQHQTCFLEVDTCYEVAHIVQVPLFIREKAKGQCGTSNSDICALVKLSGNDENQAA